MEDEYDLYMINPSGHQMADSMPWVSDGWCITEEGGTALDVGHSLLDVAVMMNSSCAIANNFIGRMING